MITAVIIALGASAMGVVLSAYCVYLSISASRRRAAAIQAEQERGRAA